MTLASLRFLPTSEFTCLFQPGRSARRRRCANLTLRLNDVEEDTNAMQSFHVRRGTRPGTRYVCAVYN